MDHHSKLVNLRTAIELPKADAYFPDGSDLFAMVEVTVTRPELQTHAWKCTRVLRLSGFQSDTGARNLSSLGH